jgi:hypothetical protein
VETSKNYQGKVKSPALKNRGQGTQIRPWATIVPPALENLVDAAAERIGGIRAPDHFLHRVRAVVTVARHNAVG